MSTLPRTRLDHFLDGHRPLPEALERHVWDRVHRARCSPDDPASVQIAVETLLELRAAAITARMDAVPGEIAEAVRAVLREVGTAHRHEVVAERAAIAERVAREAREVLGHSMPKLERQFHWRVAHRLLLTAALIGLLAAGGGYILGRHETAALGRDYAALAARPDAATWLRLQQVNGNLDVTISGDCTPGGRNRIETAWGRRACAVPLWLEGPVPRAPTAMETVGDHLASLRARLPFGAILGLGMLLGLVLAPLARRMRLWVLAGETAER
jgi:hypothetical protein